MKPLALIFYCGCGHRIWGEARHKAEGWVSFVFLDGEETSETYTQQMTRCPECGVPPIEHILEAAAAGREASDSGIRKG